MRQNSDNYRMRTVPIQKPKIHTGLKLFLSMLLFAMIGLGQNVNAQTNPAAQALPYTQTWGASTFTAMPTGTAAWNGLNGGAIGTQALAESSVPTGNATITARTTSITTGGSYSYLPSGSNVRFYHQGSSNATNGANQLAVAINTGSNTSLDISYKIEILNIGGSGSNIGSVLQYRSGTSGSWTTVSGSANVFSNPGVVLGSVSSYSYSVIGLSINTDYQFRWAHWRSSGTSLGLAYDDISFTASSGIPAPVINSALTASATYGVAATTYTITATNSPTSYTATGLPAGFSVNTTNGEITGTPTAVGTYTVNIGATNAGGTGNANLVYTINPKNLTVFGATANNKVYDATTTATIIGSTLVGVVGADVVTINGTGAFTSANVATGITVTSTQTLGGANASNYTVTLPTGLSADITAKPLTITGITADNKVFDGTTNATLSGIPVLNGLEAIDNGNVLLGGVAVATFASSAVGTGIAVSVTGYSISGSASGNYSLTQPTGLTADITSSPSPVINSSLTASAIYGTVATTYTITSTNSPTSFSATGLPTGLSVNTTNGEITGTPTDFPGNFNVLISATNAGGTGSATLVYTITAKPLSVANATADNKEYDGNATTTISGSSLVGVFGSDIVTINNTGTFASEDVANVISVTSTQTLGGADAAKYTLTLPTGLTADITPKPLTIASAQAQNKVFDGNTNAVITGTLTGIVSPDVVTFSGTGIFASSAVGTGIAVTSTSVLGGVDAGNYSLTQPTGLSANITMPPTALAVGDISIIGLRTDANDGISFVTWVDLNANTVIRFTDNAFDGSVFLSNENTVTWTNSTGNTIVAGTVISIGGPLNVNGEGTNLGSTTGALSGLSASGENVFAYQGTPISTSNVLFGIHDDGTTGWLTTGTVNTNNSYLPGTLNVTGGNIALNEIDNIQYSGTRVATSFATHKSNVALPANYTGNDDGALFGNFDLTPFTLCNPTSDTTTETACDLFTWGENSVTYTTSGTYTAVAGCHTEVLVLTINVSTTGTTTATACDSYTWSAPLGNGTTYTVGGTYTNTSTNAAGCVHTQTLVLTINASSTGTTTATACDSYTWSAPLGNGTTYTVGGTYTNTSTNAAGCVHTQTLVLTINNSTSSSATVSATNSYTWAANGVTYTASGTYTSTSLNATGCVHTETLNLTITSSSFTVSILEDQTISCNGSNNGSIQADATPFGSYTYTLDGGIASNTTGFFDNLAPGVHTVCATDGFSTVCNTVTLTQPEPLTVSLATDSTVSCVGNDGGLTATVTGGTTVIQPYLTTWQSGVTTNSIYDLSVTGLTASIYTITVEDDNGCTASTSITLGTTDLVVVTATNTAITCFGGSSVITPSASGGTGIMTNSINGGSFTVSAGTYTITSTDAKGCTGTTSITIAQPSQITGSSNATACNSYLFGGTTYTTSGVYAHTFTAANGCDSVHTLTLTINNSSANGNATVTACDSYTWSANNVTYTASGTYTFTSLNAAGCTNTATLILTINNSTSSSTSATACDSYTWSANNVTYTTGGTYTFTSLNAAGCTNTTTLILTINNSTSSSASSSSFVSYTWAANNVTYTASGVYTATLTNAAGCDSNLTLNLTIEQGISISPKVILTGAYDASTGLMHDSLRVNQLIPSTEPYSGLPFLKPQIGGPGGETVSAATLAVTGNNAIVDWVFIELRAASNASTIVATKRALLQRDGDVVDADGTSALFFNSLPGGNYYVSIKHRNHLGVMTAAPITLALNTTSIDFSSPSFAIYQNPSITVNAPRKIQGTVAMLWAGDANNNKNVKYNGLSNDKDAIVQAVGSATINSIIYGYRTEDVNMDAKVKYNNVDNDRTFIISQIGISTPNNILSQHTPN